MSKNMASSRENYAPKFCSSCQQSKNQNKKNPKVRRFSAILFCRLGIDSLIAVRIATSKNLFVSTIERTRFYKKLVCSQIVNGIQVATQDFERSVCFQTYHLPGSLVWFSVSDMEYAISSTKAFRSGLCGIVRCCGLDLRYPS